jgi:hypothetical protein
MSYSYPELADYIFNVSTLLVEHSQVPVSPLTAQQANQYAEALSAVYPLIIDKLNAYNTALQISLTNSNNVAPVQSFTVNVTPTQNTQPLLRKKSSPPVIRIGDVGTYMIGGDKYSFTVTDVQDQGKTVNIARGYYRETLKWRRPGRWIPLGETAGLFRGSYVFGVKEDYIGPSY